MSRKPRAHQGPDLARRALLRRIGLAGTIAYTAPALTALGMARASGGGSGRSGPSISGSSLSVPSGASLRRQPQQSQRRRVPPQPPEILLALPGGQSLAAVEALGYRVLGSHVNDTLALMLYRLGLPAGRSPDQARAELVRLLPDATADANPGVGLWTAASISGGRLRSGTSYAAPFVTAALAVQRMRATWMSVEEVVSHMLSCAQDLGEAGYDPVFGHGLVSAPGSCEGTASEIFSISGE